MTVLHGLPRFILTSVENRVSSEVTLAIDSRSTTERPMGRQGHGGAELYVFLLRYRLCYERVTRARRASFARLFVTPISDSRRSSRRFRRAPRRLSTTCRQRGTSGGQFRSRLALWPHPSRRTRVRF